MHITVIGNPENRRIGFFLAAARRLRLPRPQVLSWEHLLSHPDPTSLVHGQHIRLESPGENAQVEGLLVQRGARATGQPVPAWTHTPHRDHGRIRNSLLWYAGLSDILKTLQKLESPQTRFMTPPSEVLAMFDKLETRRRLEQAGVAMPGYLGLVKSAEDLIPMGQPHPRFFIKPRFGSSASGVLAYRHRPRPEVTTSAELTPHGLYNALRVRKYTAPRDIATLIDTLAADGLFAERWVPKACLDGAFDFRVFVVNGRARHTVMRVSHGPLTNLHLGNRRGDLHAFTTRAPEAMQAVWAAAEAAARCFSAISCGVDVALESTMRRAYVLEVNAFGDLLPNVLVDGRDTYEFALSEFMQ